MLQPFKVDQDLKMNATFETLVTKVNCSNDENLEN